MGGSSLKDDHLTPSISTPKEKVATSARTGASPTVAHPDDSRCQLTADDSRSPSRAAPVTGKLHQDDQDDPKEQILAFRAADASAAINVLKGLRPTKLIIDGGASIHGTQLSDHCFDKEKCSMSVAGLSGVPFVCEYKGKLIVVPEQELRPVVLRNVYVSEHFPVTFVSESVLANAGCSVLKKGTGGLVADSNGEIIFRVNQEGGLYFIDGEVVLPPPGASASMASLLKSPKVSARPSKVPAEPSKVPEGYKLAPEDFSEVNLDEGAIHLARSYAAREVMDQLTQSHRAFSHIDMRVVAETRGFILPPDFKFPICDSCVVGKAADHLITRVLR